MQMIFRIYGVMEDHYMEMDGHVDIVRFLEKVGVQPGSSNI